MERGFIALFLLFFLCACVDSGMDEKYGAKAVLEKDASICDNIRDAFRRDVCLSQVCEITRDFSLCERISDQHLRDIYYSDFAGVDLDGGKCESIINDSIKKNCIDYVSNKKRTGN
jgi:hypothetical protein